MEIKEKLVFALFFAALFSASCAPTLKRAELSPDIVASEREKQLHLALSEQIAQSNRLSEVSWSLLKAATGFCEKQISFHYGFALHSKSVYAEKFRDTVAAKFGISDEVSVRYIHPQFPAAQTGLKTGDKILKVNENNVKGRSIEEVAELILNPAAKLKEPSKDISLEDTTFPVYPMPPSGQADPPVPQGPPPTLNLEIDRGGQVIPIKVEGVKACKYRVLYVESDVVNAFADGQNIMFTSGMLRFANSDSELALVIGHEIAHNALGHIDMKRVNSIPGLILDLAIAVVGINTHGLFTQLAGNAFSQDFEAEADYMGLYILAKSGADISHAADFWRRLGATHPGSINAQMNASHPSSPERFVAIEKHVQEIEEKKARGEPLLPEKK